MAILKYSFSLTPSAAPVPAAPEARHEYAYSEFLLELAARWRQLPVQDDDTLNFFSDEDGAAIIISADFYEIPDDKAQGLAETVVASRLEAIQKASAGPVQVLHRAIKPHSGGVGLELSFAAEAESEHVHLYLGYVTSRKVLNFSMVCQPGHGAAALFNATVSGFRPRLP
ncbi:MULTISPECIES: hypothetical protein [unclassified Roseateles]|uniref:hypothetical protein n=1 Tax=Pelomonas sp. Root1237 TaxID=1736434 RepID=UPI0007008F53|nr:hypothetical protein [Pelomonas sp. Root1237]KQV86139.1 hypothetical protein ASC91_23540 [Pelomonas sp. Root1237]